MSINLLYLADMYKTQKNFEVKMTQRGLINMQEYLFLLWVFLLNLRESSTSLGTVHFLRGKGGLVEFFEVSLESCMTLPVTKFFLMTPPLL